jgi:hypothetical protein
VASTRGRVVRMVWQADLVCVWVGTGVQSASILLLQFDSTASAFALDGQAVLAQALASAFVFRAPVAVGHGNNDSRILSVEFESVDIALIGPAIHADFLGIAGSGMPADVQVVFEQGLLQVASA